MKLRTLFITLSLAATAGGLVSLQGCATYHCTKFPQGSCRNMSQIYDDTGKGFSDYREGTGDEKKDDEKKGDDSGKGSGRVVISNTVKGINELQPGDPVLTKPQTLRVWIKPWEDKDKDLNFSFVYIRVKDSTWTVLQ